MNLAAYSSLAVLVPGVRDPKLARVRTVWGFLLHTTGGGVTDAAKRKKRTPIDVAIETYIASQNGSEGYTWGGPHYVIDHDGSIHQVAPDDALTAHCGSSRRDAQGRSNRDRYMDQSWRETCSKAVVDAWTKKWSAGGRGLTAHPYSLFPSVSPNLDYVGCEMIPIGDGFGGEPMAPGLRFTKAQHDAAARLAADCGSRHGFPAGWTSSARLLGHEDVDPIERSDAGGGWDPGYLRVSPAFDFDYVRNAAS